MNITVSSDYDRYPEFQRLEKKFGITVADSIYIRLWKDLSYHAATSPLGCMPKTDFQFFFNRLGLTNLTELELMNILVDEIKLLKDANENYFCRSFFLDNQELAILPRGVKTHNTLHLHNLKKRSEKNAEKDVSTLPPEYFKEVDGQPIHDLEMNRVVVLIRCIDGIFSVVEREKKDFGVGLIHDACRAVRRFGPKKLDVILQRLQYRRDKMTSRNTAQFLSDIDRNLVELEPEEGWGVLSAFLTKP